MAPSALNKSRNWPWLAVLVALPTLALVVLRSHALWAATRFHDQGLTNTADWAFSQKIPLRISSLMSIISVRLRLVGMKQVVKPQRMGVPPRTSSCRQSPALHRQCL